MNRMGRMNEILSEGGTRFLSSRLGQMIRIQEEEGQGGGGLEGIEF